MTLDNVKANTDVLSVLINNNYLVNNADRINQLRNVELAYYSVSYDSVSTMMIFDNLAVSQAEARFSMYTTLFITIILVVSFEKKYQINFLFERFLHYILILNCLMFIFIFLCFYFFLFLFLYLFHIIYYDYHLIYQSSTYFYFYLPTFFFNFY